MIHLRYRVERIKNRATDAINRRHTVQPQEFTSKHVEAQRSNFVYTVLVNGNLQNETELNTALLGWIQNFGFRTDDQIDLSELDLTYAATERNSIKYLEVFLRRHLHKSFSGGKAHPDYKKAKNFCKSMLAHYNAGKFKEFSYIQP